MSWHSLCATNYHAECNMQLALTDQRVCPKQGRYGPTGSYNCQKAPQRRRKSEMKAEEKWNEIEAIGIYCQKLSWSTLVFLRLRSNLPYHPFKAHHWQNECFRANFPSLYMFCRSDITTWDTMLTDTNLGPYLSWIGTDCMQHVMMLLVSLVIPLGIRFGIATTTATVWLWNREKRVMRTYLKSKMRLNINFNTTFKKQASKESFTSK